MATKPPVKGKTISEAKAMDAQSNAMMFEGASLSQLSRIFRQDIRKIKGKLHGLNPSNHRGSHPVYDIAEAARYLVKPMWPIEEWVKRLKSAHDLPVEISKEFWAGQRSQQLVMRDAGDLWPTDKVVEMVTELFKTMALSLRLVDDMVDSEATLSTRQREIVRRLMDEALNNTRESLEKVLLESRNRGGMSVGRSSEDPIDDDEI